VKKLDFNLNEVVRSIAISREIDEELVIEALKTSIISVILRIHRQMTDRKSEDTDKKIEVNFDMDKKILEIYIEKIIVKDDPDGLFEISMDEAKSIWKRKRLKVGDIVKTTFDIDRFSRSNVRKIQQIFFNRVKIFEKMHIYKEFQQNKLHTVITGSVFRVDSKRRQIVVDLGKINGRLPFNKKLLNDKFKVGDKVKAYVEDINQDIDSYNIILTRTSSDFIKYLLKLEVPEISNNIVEIINICRVPGRRTKIAVYSKSLKIDPVGAVIGLHGNRINIIKNEINRENIDVIKWDKEPEIFIKNSLKPAEILEVKINRKEKKALAVVKDDAEGKMKARAIGEHGLNIKLAERLTGWNIVIVTERELAAIMKQEAALINKKISELMSTPSIGVKKANLLVSYGFDSIDKIIDLKPENLTVIPGFGKKIAADIINKVKKAKKAKETEKIDTVKKSTKVKKTIKSKKIEKSKKEKKTTKAKQTTKTTKTKKTKKTKRTKTSRGKKE
jgi:N utilization substance protein A